MSTSILSLPPVLQELWSRVYAAGIEGELSRYSIDSETSPPSDESIAMWAENHAWEAVRRANGGEMPEEHEREEATCAVAATRTPNEPTDEGMVEALAPIVAESVYGSGWANLCAEDQDRRRLYATSTLIERASSADRAALASWKAARAWGRK